MRFGKLAIPTMTRFCKFQKTKAELASASVRGLLPLRRPALVGMPEKLSNGSMFANG